MIWYLIVFIAGALADRFGPAFIRRGWAKLTGKIEEQLRP